MAAPLLPEDVTEHLEAAIQLSNRRIHLRFLDEAETLRSLQFPAAAISVAGVVLEYVVAGQRIDADPNELRKIEEWSQLRNNAVHSYGRSASPEEAREMVAGVRRLLLRPTFSGPRLALKSSANTSTERIRGKYKFVPTSSADFIARKADELRLEY